MALRKKQASVTPKVESSGIDYNKIERFTPDFMNGLSSDQVNARISAGYKNGESDIKTKSIGRIIRDNVITPFNILNFILGILVISVGSFKNVLFLNIIFLNICIGSFQEIRAKKTIDRLSLISSPKASVLRNGIVEKIPVSEIVLDDVLHLSSGNQICCDCTVLEGSCEVNEALITGESDPLPKTVGDGMLSGSFLSSGSCYARVEHIGVDNYATKISNSAKYIKKNNSEILKWINIIIKVIGIIIIPVGLLLFYKEIFVSHTPYQDAVVGIVAALIGMIPEGLILLTSVVFAVGVVRLSRHKTLVQELYCIETLARVDTLCLDKTGTITEGEMQLDHIIPYSGMSEDEVKEALCAMLHAQTDTNPTFDAIRMALGDESNWLSNQVVPFSSARKWSGASFSDRGAYVMGALEFVFSNPDETLSQRAKDFSERGFRVLVAAKSTYSFNGNELPAALEPIGLVVLSDKIRPSARLTLEYFADQGVDIKVISGDNAATVSNVASKAGLQGAENYIDATTLSTPEEIAAAAGEYTVFGRVTPQQKLELVKALQKQGHTVAMTGDGVNDVLALKEADCSIAMASGSDAARTVSQLVLLNSDFSSLPHVVREGRRSINNLQRSAALYLVKAIFSTILAIFFVFTSATYPFQPIQLTLISFATIGTPSFILALEPNSDRVKGRFIFNVMTNALPCALTIAFNIIFLTAIYSFLNLSYLEYSTLAVFITGFTSFMMLLKVCSPLNTIRTTLFVTMALVFVFGIVFFREFFGLVQISAVMIVILIPMIFLSIFLILAIQQLVNKLIERRGGR